MYCIKCGAENPEGAAFCYKCGAPMVKKNGGPDAGRPAEPPAEPAETPTEPVAVPVEPAAAPAESVETPTEPVTAPVESSETPATPAVAPAESVETPAEPAAAPATPAAVPAEPAETPATSAEAPAESSEVPTAPSEVPTDGEAEPGSGKKKAGGRWAVLAACVGVAVLAAILIFAFSGRSAESTAKKFLRAYLDGDSEEIVDLMPKRIIRELADEKGVRTRDMREFLEEVFEDEFFTDDMADDSRVKIDSVAFLDISETEKASVREMYRAYGVKVRDAGKVRVNYSIRGAANDTGSVEIPVVKVGRSWYYDGQRFDLGTAFSFTPFHGGGPF